MYQAQNIQPSTSVKSGVASRANTSEVTKCPSVQNLNEVIPWAIANVSNLETEILADLSSAVNVEENCSFGSNHLQTEVGHRSDVLSAQGDHSRGRSIQRKAVSRKRSRSLSEDIEKSSRQLLKNGRKRSCSVSGRNKLSLEEYRSKLAKKPKLDAEQTDSVSSKEDISAEVTKDVKNVNLSDQDCFPEKTEKTDYGSPTFSQEAKQKPFDVTKIICMASSVFGAALRDPRRKNFLHTDPRTQPAGQGVGGMNSIIGNKSESEKHMKISAAYKSNARFCEARAAIQAMVPIDTRLKETCTDGNIPEQFEQKQKHEDACSRFVPAEGMNEEGVTRTNTKSSKKPVFLPFKPDRVLNVQSDLERLQLYKRCFDRRNAQDKRHRKKEWKKKQKMLRVENQKLNSGEDVAVFDTNIISVPHEVRLEKLTSNSSKLKVSARGTGEKPVEVCSPLTEKVALSGNSETSESSSISDFIIIDEYVRDQEVSGDINCDQQTGCSMSESTEIQVDQKGENPNPCSHKGVSVTSDRIAVKYDAVLSMTSLDKKNQAFKITTEPKEIGEGIETRAGDTSHTAEVEEDAEMNVCDKIAKCHSVKGKGNIMSRKRIIDKEKKACEITTEQKESRENIETPASHISCTNEVFKGKVTTPCDKIAVPDSLDTVASCQSEIDSRKDI